MLAPADCRTKDDVRAEIDRIDRQIVPLLAERFGYIKRMAELKQSPEEARVPARVEAVLDHVAELAEEAGFAPDLARLLWARMIEWNEAYEADIIRARLAGAA
ncbi:chorismate mutase [Prosthecomicrobium pneumaticum]|uniref:chorismate mutase n=1 Tax=Prosthecomicrobium pneumaticum TaxID=81895 RepID=A0A7W9CSW9_9HYPH|nr:chorismate mutase [Prosthecomicrobium pneumaticum]MBB5751280.1 isochorismate pyruvate lyase [Prosthecomicrobium pneumaticum]